MEEDYNLAERYRIVRKHLDRLGYRQALSLDALPLIERLLADLIQTTDSLKHFKTVAQDNIEACSQLQLATEPYKCDNARLVQECNQLHLKLLDTNESHQKQIKVLRKQVRKLESEANDLQLVSARQVKKIKELEVESAGKSSKILELQGKCCKPVISNTNLATKKRACYPLRRPTLEADPLPRTGSSSVTLPSSSSVDPHVVDLMEMADHRMNCLNREVTKLKGELSVQSDNTHTLKSQLATKEKEIIRLKKMLDGGRPLAAVTKDCFCKKAEKNHYGDVGDLKILERAKQDLEEQLKDSMSKQHEAMSRALKLAERNEELEKELRDIDHIALAVEADCNSAVQENNRRVSRLQEKVEDLMTQVHVLESELTVERREAQELRADLEGCKLEKRNIQRVLESTLDEKKQMTDRINQLTIIEKDLNDAIERLTREITHLESSNNILKNQTYANGGGGGGGGGDEREKHKEKGEKNDKNKGKKILKKKTTAGKTQATSPIMNRPNLNGHHREDEVSKDVSNIASAGLRNLENQKSENEKDSIIQSLKKTIERLETERDYYRNEYNKFREEFNLISNRDNADLWTQACELRRQLNEKEQAMAELQREKKALDREKFNLEARLQTSKSQQRRACINCSPRRSSGPCICSTTPSPSGGDAGSTKVMIERLERERDTARADVDRLAEERDALRERLKIAVDAHTSEQRRLRESLSDAESRLKQLETERQDLMLSQGTRRATINGLEDQLEDLRQELRRTKEELTTQRTQYFQLRALQEQTDQALGDVQGQLGQSETELNKMMDHKRNIEQQQMQLDNQVKELKQESNMLRANLAQLDQEKDQLLMNLDEKTERIAALEREVRFKEQQGHGLEQQVGDFQHKYQICVDQTAEQERQLRTMEVEINNLQRQLNSANMDRENAIRENSRIQDDLASVTCECRNLQRELEVSRAESYDLKRQLQTYVTEVRRAEDLLNRKENERSEMLNHFRSLSLEATVLETNNQSLESEAAEARGALQTAQDRLLDLERQIADRDCLIRGYETQISELTQNVASMETQLHQQGEQRKRAEADLNAVRDLCVKLDQQKESLEAQLGDKEAMRAQCESQLARLRAEQNMVQDQMSRDNAAVDRLEAMLNQARQESMSNQATNQELQSEMARLKQKIADLQNKLLSETSELRRYQNQAAEYSKQIGELRRQMTNERFDRARKEEESRSHRIHEDSKEGCCGRPDLKTEAQRTNRFNGDEFKMQEKDELPCINIILKPVLNSKTEQNDKGVQIVEVTAVRDNMNNRFTKNANTSTKETEKIETKCVKVQTQVEQNIQDSGIQTEDELIDEKNSIPHLPKQETGTNAQNRSVQFRNNGATGNAATCNPHLSDAVHPDAQTLPDEDRDAIEITRIDHFTSTQIPEDRRGRIVEQEVPLPHVDCCNSMETLYKSVRTGNESSGAPDSQPRLQKTPTKLSDRINRDIDKLETKTSAQTTNPSNAVRQESMRTQTKPLPCSDTCKDIVSRVKLLETYSNRSDASTANGSTSTGDTGTLPSVFSNNPPIPRVFINTTEMTEPQSPTKSKSSRDAGSSASHDNTNSCSDQNFSTNDTDYSDDGRNKRNVELFNSGGKTRDFSDGESETLSKIGIEGNSASADTLVGDKTLESTGYLSLIKDDTAGHISGTSSAKGNSKCGERSGFISPIPNVRNLLTASDLTRPEFIRMLTEIKEHTCSLEMQLFTMNEALKRKQATRRKVLSSTLKSSDSSKRDCLARETQNEIEPFSCGGEVSSIKYARLGPEEVNLKNLSNSSCATPDDDSMSEDRRLEDGIDDDETCCSSVSISKRKQKKPVFKTKRSYLWTSVRESDYRMGKSKPHKLSPTEKCMLAPKVLSPCVSPQPIIACSSPKNCCDEPEVFKAESLSPIQKPEKPEAPTRPTVSTTSNPPANRMLAKPAIIMISASKRSPKAKVTAKINGNKDPKMQNAVRTPDGKAENESLLSPCGLDSSKKSNSREMCCEGGKTEQEQTEVDPSSPSTLNKPKAKESPESTETNSTPGEESAFYESLLEVSPPNTQTPSNDAKASPSRLRKGGAIPRLKRLVNPSRSPAQTHGEKTDSETRPSSNSGKDHIAYVIKTEQNTPFLVNNVISSSYNDSEEEVNSTDYGVNNSTDKNKNYAKKSKDDVNDRKRKRGNESMEYNRRNRLNTSDQVLPYNCKKNSQALSGDRKNFGKYNQNNSQHKDSKCTIRVTVSLDGTSSNEKVEENFLNHIPRGY